MKVLLALTPFVCRIWWLCEHSLVKPYDFSLLIICLLQSLLHCIKQRNISTILRFDRHLGDIDDLPFYQVLLVHEAQAPWLDEFFRELPMKKYTTFLDTPRDPRFESRLWCQIIYMFLCQSKWLWILLNSYIRNMIRFAVISKILKLKTVVSSSTVR